MGTIRRPDLSGAGYRHLGHFARSDVTQQGHNFGIGDLPGVKKIKKLVKKAVGKVPKPPLPSLGVAKKTINIPKKVSGSVPKAGSRRPITTIRQALDAGVPSPRRIRKLTGWGKKRIL